jgi:hypothetical protein
VTGCKPIAILLQPISSFSRLLRHPCRKERGAIILSRTLHKTRNYGSGYLRNHYQKSGFALRPIRICENMVHSSRRTISTVIYALDPMSVILNSLRHSKISIPEKIATLCNSAVASHYMTYFKRSFLNGLDMYQGLA